ncbi:MAG: hypothetical protein ABJC79_17305 [Acidimicrobiia bacterium]
MEITVQYFEGCPNVGVVRRRLALAVVDPSAVRLVDVGSPERDDASRWSGE